MPGLIGPDEVRRVSEAALSLDGADGVEVLFLHEWGGLTRFADSAVHAGQFTGWRSNGLAASASHCPKATVPAPVRQPRIDLTRARCRDRSP